MMAMEDEVCVDTPPHDYLCVSWHADRYWLHQMELQGFNTCVCPLIAQAKGEQQ
jgi:hypothetical protein